MNKLDQQTLESCGLCHATCNCYRMLNDQPYCGATGKLTTEGSYCHALRSTKGTMMIDPFDNFPDTIKNDYRTDKLIDEIGQSNYNRLVKCAKMRGLFEAFIHKTIHEFNAFVMLITIGNLSTNNAYKYLYDKYNKYSNAALNELIEQFENYCLERYGG